MIDAKQLKSLKIQDCNPGDLVLANQHTSGATPGLVAKDGDGLGVLWFGRNEGDNYSFRPMQSGQTAFLVVSDWRIKVEIDSYTSPFKGDYEPGSVAIDDGKICLIGTRGHSTCLYSIDGQRMDDVKADFMFSEWSVVIGEGPETVQLWPLKAED
ncbi:hypothetical protein WJT74_07705 [Sphingomicrobium sp. XHP0239]|uniref:hypothetical protein n=1 Tax=Sphingomicrobium maritimum TaxID=3133972 RepID=UPI0031CC79E8